MVGCSAALALVPFCLASFDGKAYNHSGPSPLTPPPLPPSALQAALAPDDISPLARPTGAWLVLTVQLKCEQSVTITREEDGQVVAELK